MGESTSTGLALEIPRFEGGLEEIMHSLVSWVDKRVERRRWSDEEIDEKFAKRSANQILEEGHTCYMNPCLDLTLIAYEALRQHGFKPTLVVEEEKCVYYPFNVLHFAIEFLYEGAVYSIDFTTLNRVSLRRGLFESQKEGVERVQLIRVDEEIDPAKNVFENGAEYREQLQNYDFGKTLAKLKKNNTPETYDRYLNVLGENGCLYLDADI